MILILYFVIFVQSQFLTLNMPEVRSVFVPVGQVQRGYEVVKHPFERQFKVKNNFQIKKMNFLSNGQDNWKMEKRNSGGVVSVLGNLYSKPKIYIY